MPLIAQLNVPYATSQATDDDREFLSALLDYAEALQLHYPSIPRALYEMEKSECEPERRTYAIAARAIDELFGVLLSQAQKENAPPEEVKELVQAFEAASDQTDDSKLITKHNELDKLAWFMGSEIVVPEFEEWWSHCRNKRARHQLRPWFSWNRIKRLLDALKANTDMLSESKDLLDDWLTMDSIMGDNEPDPEFVFEFKTHLRRVHAFAQDYVGDENDNPKILGAQQSPTWKFDKSTNTLTIGGKDVKFKPGGSRTAVLKVLVRVPGKTWSWDEVYELMEPDVGQVEGLRPEPKRNPRDKVLDALRGIDRHIAKSALVNDFLIYNSQTSQINPKYIHLG